MKYYTKKEIKERVSCVKRGHFNTSLPRIKTKHLVSPNGNRATKVECEQRYFFVAEDMRELVDGLYYFLNSER